MTSIMLSCATNDIDITNLLLKYKPDLNLTSVQNKTVLMYCIERNFKEMFMILLNHGADINFKNRTNRTAIYYAVKHNNIEIVQILCDLGVDINIQDTFEISPVMMACGKEDNKILKILLAKKTIDIKLMLKNNTTMLHHVLNNECLNLLLETYDTFIHDIINIPDDNKITLLMKLCDRGIVDIIPKLIERYNIDIQSMDKINMNACMFLCEYITENRIVRDNSDSDFELKQKEQNNNIKKCVNTIKLFIDSGLDLTIKSKYGSTLEYIINAVTYSEFLLIFNDKPKIDKIFNSLEFLTIVNLLKNLEKFDILIYIYKTFLFSQVLEINGCLYQAFNNSLGDVNVTRVMASYV